MKYVTKENREGKVVKLKDYKKRAKINKLKRKLLLITFLLIVLSLILCFTPILQVRKITCTGNNMIPADEIITASKIEVGNNMIRTSKKKAIDNIDNLSYIKSVEIIKSFPSTIKIKVVECTVHSYTFVDKKYLYLDEDGKVLEISDKQPEISAPLLKTSKIKSYKVNEVLGFADSKQAEIYKTLITTLKGSVFADILTNIDISDANNISFTVNNQFTVKLGDISELDYKVNNMATEGYNSPESSKKGTFDVSITKGKGYLKQEQE